MSFLKRINLFLKSYWLKKPPVGIRKILASYFLSFFIFFSALFLKEYWLLFLSFLFLFGMTIYFFKQGKKFGYYHRLKKFEDLGVMIEIRDFILPDNPSENRREIYAKNKDVFYSKMFHNQAKTKQASYDYCRLLLDVFFPMGPQKSLILGGGGGAVSSMMVKRYRQAQVEVVEVSQTMIKIAKKYFHSPARVKFINQDAFDFVKRNKGKYDFIFVNIFVGEKLPIFLVKVSLLTVWILFLKRKEY